MPVQTTPPSIAASRPSTAPAAAPASAPIPAPVDPPEAAPPVIFQRLDTVTAFPYTLREYARRTLWEIVQATLFRFSPRRAHRWRRFWLRLFGAKLAGRCFFWNTTRIKHPWLLTVGYYSAIAEDVNVYNLGPITIGEHTVISQGAHLCAGTHDYTRPNLPLLRPPIIIGSGVWVCAEAFIGPNVTIGDNAIVGARAVVVRDVPPGVMVAGNPAQIIKTRPMPGHVF